MFADLHLHTNYSDGTLTPGEAVRKAAKHGMGLISVCDHNTVAAYPELMQHCAASGIKLITGVEIDCFMGDRYVHLLGYGFNLADPGLLALLADCYGKMRYLNDVVIINMADDYNIDLNEYAAYVSPRSIGGYKNSNFLLHKGIIKTIPEYFPLSNKFGIKIETLGLPQLDHACRVIKAAGGFPVLAHPAGRRDPDKFIAELQTAVDAGVMGLECYYPDQDAAATATCVSFCRERGLLITVGSDDHGEFNRTIGGVVYQIGEVVVDVGLLNLRGVL